MKKKLLLSIVISMAVCLNVNAETKENTNIGYKMTNEALISIVDKNNQEHIQTYNHHFPKIHSGRIPTLDKINKFLDKTSEQNTQIDSAKSISDRINDALKNNHAIKIDTETAKQIVNVDDCVKIALANHPSIAYYKSSAEIYKSKIAQAWSAYFPRFNASIEYSRNDMLLTAMDVGEQKYNMFYMPALGVDWLLFDFGKGKTLVDIARKTYQASEENVKMSINK